MDKQLFIPDRICVGFQNRSDTYTKKLAYVIYYDHKGVLRKEKSWQSWRDDKIDSINYDNVPTEGFVLNKGVGGQRQSYGWNARNEYIRVYDPRDFEFEISVSNLLFILRECDCSKGKGLEGKFAYAWDGTELVLLPEISTDYQNSKKYTALQMCGIKAKHLIPGASYITKKQKVLVYLGRFDYYDVKNCSKKYIFLDDKQFVVLDSLKTIATLNSDVIIANYAELVDQYNKSRNGSKIIKLFTKKIVFKESHYDYWVIENPDGSYTEFHTNYWNGKIQDTQAYSRIYFKDGFLKTDPEHWMAYAPTRRIHSSYYGNTEHDWIEPTNLRLFALLESGTEVRISHNCFVKDNYGQE